jgi:hypothetical protein
VSGCREPSLVPSSPAYLARTAIERRWTSAHVSGSMMRRFRKRLRDECPVLEHGVLEDAALDTVGIRANFLEQPQPTVHEGRRSGSVGRVERQHLVKQLGDPAAEVAWARAEGLELHGGQHVIPGGPPRGVPSGKQFGEDEAQLKHVRFHAERCLVLGIGDEVGVR